MSTSHNAPVAPAAAAPVAPRLLESQYMPETCRAILKRGKSLDLKGKARDRDEEACMQGALAALTAAGVTTHDRAAQIAFLCLVGRLPQFIRDQAAAE